MPDVGGLSPFYFFSGGNFTVLEKRLYYVFNFLINFFTSALLIDFFYNGC